MIECAGLTKGFGEAPVLEDLTLKVAPGEALGLAGPAGAGKSVALRLFMGLMRPDAGSASIAGLDCFAQRKAVHKHAAFAQAAPALDARAHAEDYIGFVRRYAGGFSAKRAAAFEERMGFTAVGHIRRMGPEDRKKLGLLAAFALERDALLLDEPFTSLSPMARAALAGLVRDEAEGGRAVLMTAHALDDARRACTHIGIIRKGKLVVSQSAEAMRHVRQKVYHVTFASANEAAGFAREWEDAVELIGARALVAVPASPQAFIRTLARYEVVDLTGGREEGEEGFLRFHGDELT